MATPAPAQDWTPHTAAALLDASFATVDACQTALDQAQMRRSDAPAVHGLSYAHLFEQGRCESFLHQNIVAWRIRMHWR